MTLATENIVQFHKSQINLKLNLKLAKNIEQYKELLLGSGSEQYHSHSMCNYV